MKELTHNDRESIIDAVTLYTCTKNCMGYEDNSAGCCTLGTRDYIIGPIPDAQALLDRLNETSDKQYAWKDVFYDYEEGSKLFPDKKNWQDEKVYPALRIDMDKEDLPCMFLGEDRLCTIHTIRSNTCRNFSCGFLKELAEKF